MSRSFRRVAADYRRAGDCFRSGRGSNKGVGVCRPAGSSCLHPVAEPLPMLLARLPWVLSDDRVQRNVLTRNQPIPRVTGGMSV